MGELYSDREREIADVSAHTLLTPCFHKELQQLGGPCFFAHAQVREGAITPSNCAVKLRPQIAPSNCAFTILVLIVRMPSSSRGEGSRRRRRKRKSGKKGSMWMNTNYDDVEVNLQISS